MLWTIFVVREFSVSLRKVGYVGAIQKQLPCVTHSNASRRWLRRSTRPHQPRPVERERNCQVPALPANQHKHVAGTRIFGRQAPDFDRLSLSEWAKPPWTR